MSVITKAPYLTGMMIAFSILGLSGCGDKETNNITNNAIDEEPRIIINTALSCNGVMSLDTSASYDPDGKPLTYQWTLVEAPSGSQLTNSFNKPVSPKLSVLADKSGDYQFRVLVSDGTKQASWIYNFRVNIPNYSVKFTQQLQTGINNTNNTELCFNPMEFASNIRQGVINTTVNQAFTLDGALVGNTDKELSYQWRVLKSPTDSTFTLGNDKTSKLDFTAQQSGDYTLALEVQKAGQAFAAAVVNLRATEFKSHSLTGDIKQAELIANSQRLATIAQDNLFRVEDLSTKTVKTLTLDSMPRTFALSPDGTRAVVAMKDKVSVLNVNGMAIIKTWPITPTFTIQDLKMVNNKLAYFIPNTTDGFPNLSNITTLGLFNTETGEFNSAESLLSNFSSYGRKTFLASPAATLFMQGDLSYYGSITKIELDGNGLVFKTQNYSALNNCFNANNNIMLISNSLLFGCGAFYELNASNTPKLIDNVMLNIYPQNPIFSQYVPSFDGKSIYGIVSNNNSMTNESLDIVKIGVDSKKDEAKLNIPMVLADDLMQYPTITKVLSNSNMPMAVLSYVQLKNGKKAYYLMTM